MAYNNKNYVVNWVANSATALYDGSLDTDYLDLSIPLTNGIPISAPRTGVISYNYNLPANNLRYITFNSTTAGAAFEITGINIIPATHLSAPGSFQTSPIVTETVTCTSASTTYRSANFYSKIYSIVPTVMPSDITTLEIGYGNGSDSGSGLTVPYYADVWNKANNYSVAISNLDDVSSLSLSLTYSLDNDTYYAANITQPPFVISPAGFTNPMVEDGIVSFVNIPLASIAIQVGGNGSFTATIMQQGAAY